MPTFSYEAVDSAGKKVQDEIESPTKEEAVNAIHSKGLFPSSVKEKTGGTGTAKAEKKEKEKKRKFGSVGGKIPSKILVEFTVQLSILQDAGLPIVRSLKILTEQARNANLAATVQVVIEDVESGSTLSEALSKHPRIFDRLFTNMVRAGEMGGVLDVILRRLAEFMEKAQKLKKRVIGALVYPISVLSIATIILAGIMIFIIPQFKQIFGDLNVELPQATLILMATSDLVKAWWFLIPGIPFFIIFLFKQVRKNPSGRLLIDEASLRIPVFGVIVRKSNVSRFTRTLGTLITSGVPILEALAIIKSAIDNQVIANAINMIHDSIREGESIAEPMGASGVFDPMVVNMVDVGEETGELDKMLMKVADTYDNDVEVAVDAMVSLIEPAMIIFMGGTVGFIVIALFLPLIKLVETL
ncbi:MAG: type II secretion system F family protein [Planctomycetota bacterium]